MIQKGNDSLMLIVRRKKQEFEQKLPLSSLFSNAATRLLLLFKLAVAKLLLLIKLLLKFVDESSLIAGSLPPKSINFSSTDFVGIAGGSIGVLM